MSILDRTKRKTPRESEAPRRAKSRRTRFTPYLLVGLPALYLLLFTGIPLAKGLQLGFTDTRLLRPGGGRFVGVENYVDILGDPHFMSSLLTTLIYTFFCVAGAVLLGCASAFVINHSFPGRLIARTIMIFPWAVPTVAVALVFRWIYNGDGIANSASQALGVGEIGWLTDPNYGLPAIIIATVWKISPFVMLVMLAALQSVPKELFEAARVDGAGSWDAFRAVTIPHIVPTLRVVGLLMTIWAFRRFEIIWLLTGGGPVDATNTIVVNVYRQAFSNSQLGVAAAVGTIGLVLSLTVTALYFIAEKRAQQKNGI